jgi:hypothetical protein
MYNSTVLAARLKDIDCKMLNFSRIRRLKDAQLLEVLASL